MWPDGVAGVSKNGLFRVSAPWVNTKLPPGHSSQTQTLGLRSTIMNVITLKYLVMSPNLVWLAIAAAIYIVFPYDIPGAAASGSASAATWIAARGAVNFALCFTYTAFFRVQLYWRNRAARKCDRSFLRCIFVTSSPGIGHSPPPTCSTAFTTCSTGALALRSGRGGNGLRAAFGLLETCPISATKLLCPARPSCCRPQPWCSPCPSGGAF